MIQTGTSETVPITAGLKEALLMKMPESEVPRWLAEALVVEAAREHIISRRKAATLLGYVDYQEREDFFERHQLYLEYTMEMVEEDFKTIEALRKKR